MTDINRESRQGALEDKNIHDEAKFRDMYPEILHILLIDQTRSKGLRNGKTKNIIWANENYKELGFESYGPESSIEPEMVTGHREHLIRPRALKSSAMQKERTKTKAEVFTPLWIVKLQNDEVDKAFREDDLKTYIKRTWLEITCGEGPYMATRYDMETGAIIDLDKREGFVDRKLRRIHEAFKDRKAQLDHCQHVDELDTIARHFTAKHGSSDKSSKSSKQKSNAAEMSPANHTSAQVEFTAESIRHMLREEWQALVEEAYKASYGFEWNGDSLLLARENLLYTYLDYYEALWQEEPPYEYLKEIATIISYNVFQMDGLTYTLPLSEKRVPVQDSLFDAPSKEDWEIIPGEPVYIRNWHKKRKEMKKFTDSM